MTANTPAPGNPLQIAPFPDVSLIRQVASFLGRHDVLTLLETIMHQVLGDAPQVREVALGFAGDQSFFKASEHVSASQRELSGHWEGTAADQFGALATRTEGVLTGNQAAVHSFSQALAKAAELVMEAYIKLAEFVGACAASLGGLGMKIAIALGTSTIPILNIFTAEEVLNTVADAFTTLLDNANSLIAEYGLLLGQHLTVAIDLERSGAGFQDLPDSPTHSRIGDKEYWEINPGADRKTS